MYTCDDVILSTWTQLTVDLYMCIMYPITDSLEQYTSLRGTQYMCL